ncbi:hypothetical protein WJ973_25425 [Achromobacter xylosoxidans]
MAKDIKTVDSHAAFVLMVGLLQAIPWIVHNPSQGLPSISVRDERRAEAITVIFVICRSRCLNGWPPRTHADTRATVSYLLMDFMVKLKDPQSDFSARSWDVPDDQPAYIQALEILESEVLRPHPFT